MASVQAVGQIDLLVVDDNEFRSQVVPSFSRSGFHVHEAASAEQALEILRRHEIAVAVLGLNMSHSVGLQLLEQIKADHPECELLCLLSQASEQVNAAANKLGLFVCLSKPIPLEQLEGFVAKAARQVQLARENRRMKALLQRAASAVEVIGRCPALQQVMQFIEQAAPGDNPILIQGERGTGKRLVAQALHARSTRADKPFASVNCAMASEAMLASELFGHQKDAVPGATSPQPGLLEIADGGTLLLDDIDELPHALQLKLFQACDDGLVCRIGSDKQRRINVRLIATTEGELSEEVAAGRLPKDFYDRLSAATVKLPPLRERNEDVALLLKHFLGNPWTIEPPAEQAILAYPWPGNVRQLIHTLDGAKMLAEDHLIRLRDLPPAIVEQDGFAISVGDIDDLYTIERRKVVEVLRRERGNKARTARALGIDRRKLYRLIEKYQIAEDEVNQGAKSGE